MASETKVSADEKLQLGGEATRFSNIALGVGAVSLVAGVAIGLGDKEGLLRSYLTAFMYVLSITLGLFWFVAINNLVNAKWWIVVRRVAEILASQMPVIALLSLGIILPIALVDTAGEGAIQSLYAWLSDAQVHASHLLHHKSAYLNKPFFLIRVVAYFAFWAGVSLWYLNRSLAQDKASKAESELIAQQMGRVSAPVMIGFGLTLTFCAFDLLMSLDYTWFSTIFGVYYFAGSVLSAYATMVLTLLLLQRAGALKSYVNENHYHDLGKTMFAFTVFWAYIGFSQFMLIWYADIPEETHWYQWRLRGGWELISYGLIVLHFAIPFFGLLSRNVKRNRKWLGFWAAWLLIMHYVDIYWLVFPKDNEGTVPFGVVDVLVVVGLVGLLAGVAARRAKGMQLVPVKDARLPQSIAFENY
ncbi:MAG: hypothetical protein RJA70_2881 [Pseudomonadota bacterium]|jgi:hypothetical protein